ncbi:MATE family efflux transporter [Clostridium carnis]
MNEKRLNILANEKVTKAIFKMSLPMVMGMMVQVLYNLVDTYFIGRLNDSNQLAAANIAFPIFIVFMALAGTVGLGAASYISRALGDNKNEIANKTASIAVVLCMAIGILISVLGLIFIKPLVSILGASDNTFIYSIQYVGIMLLGGIFIIGNFALGQLLRAEGGAMQSMMGLLIGTVANIILDPILIFTFNMDIVGAALATIIGNLLGFLYYAYVFYKQKTVTKINLKLFSFDKKIFKEIFKIGIPASLGQMLMSIAIIVSNNIAVNYGDTTIAGMGVASKIMTIGTFIFMGFSSGCQPLVGFSYGAKNINRIKEIIFKGILITSIIGITLAILFSIFAKPLITLFINDTEVINTGAIILSALSISLPFIGGQMVSTTSVQSMGKAVPALILSISRQGILYIPLIIILNKIAGFSGFIYAQPITDVIMFGLCIIVLITVLVREEKIYNKERKIG